MTTVVFDLDLIVEETTLNLRNRDDYTMRCNECNTVIHQDENSCSGCGVYVKWKNSRVSKRARKSSVGSNRKALVGKILQVAHDSPEMFIINSALAEILELAKRCN